MMAVPPHTGHTVHMFVLLLREMSEQENHFVLCGSILLNSNKTRHSQPQKNKSRYAAHPPLVVAFSGWFCIVKIRPELAMSCSYSAVCPGGKSLNPQMEQEKNCQVL